MLPFLFKLHYEVCPKFPLTCDGCGKKISQEKVKPFLPLGGVVYDQKQQSEVYVLLLG